MTIIADCVNNELRETIDSYKTSNIEILHEELGSNGASFRFQIELAANLSDGEIILFQEDDYLYKSACWPYDSRITYHELTKEALGSLSTCPFTIIQTNTYLQNLEEINLLQIKVENTGIFRTKNSH